MKVTSGFRDSSDLRTEHARKSDRYSSAYYNQWGSINWHEGLLGHLSMKASVESGPLNYDCFVISSKSEMQIDSRIRKKPALRVEQLVSPRERWAGLCHGCLEERWPWLRKSHPEVRWKGLKP